LPLRGNSCLLLPPIDLPARSKVAMKVRVRIPDSTRRGRHDVYVRQMFKDIEVGRVTWRLQRQIKT
jgi:hypothetical protein